MTIRLLMPHDCRGIRQKVPASALLGFETVGTLVAQYGPIKLVFATGRASCRCCGLKLGKGIVVIQACCEFPTSACAGSFSAQTCYIHRSACREGS